MKHTPGTWTATIDHSREAGSYPRTLIMANGYCVAKCWQKDFAVDKQEAEANARLIAAAPDLLQALARLVDRIEEQKLQDYFPHAYKRALEAINKALA
jgi:hypothetical protein